MRHNVVHRLIWGVSPLALVAMMSGAAQADCVPYPTVENGTTHCTGANGGGILLDATGATLTLDDGASVTATTTAGIVMASHSPAQGNGNDLYLTIGGNVVGGSQSGVLVQNGIVPNSAAVAATRAHITVGANGNIAGSTGIRLQESAGNRGGLIYASLDNSGAITAASGPAIQTATGSTFFGRAGFLEIVNRASGSIGGIDAAVGALQNDGTIDGGTLSAIHGGMNDMVFNGSASIPFGITNHGLISSASAAPTIDGQRIIVNDGIIANRSGGSALSADFILLTNAAGGVIETAGDTAISAGGVRLVNRGTIHGSVNAVAPGFGEQPSSIDSVGGIIDGDVTLGDGDDVVFAGVNDGVLFTGIAGRLDAGGGENTIEIDAHQDLTLSSPIVLPSGFSSLALGLDNDATITLARGFVLPSSPLLLAGEGSGTLVNDTDLVSDGPMFRFPYPGLTISFINNGTVTSTLAHSYDYAVTLYASNSVNAFVNKGVITANGGGGVVLSGNTTFTNDGTITATNTAVSTFAVPFINNGTISSTNGTGLEMSAGQDTDRNNGLIEGATVGAAIGSHLFHNAGTIRSPKVGVALGYFGGIYNETGGVISGGTAAVTALGSTFSQVTVVNAGAINGDVDLNSGALPTSSGDSRNFYVALPGGVLNGDLVLGSGGDTFVTDLENSGPGAYAGVTGAVSGGGFETIRYRVAADASVTLAPAGGPFGATGYELSNAARLTLGADAPVAASLLFAGAGTIDLTADVSQTDHPVISTAPVYEIGTESVLGSADVDITSHGTLTLARSSPAAPVYAAVQLGGLERFTNDGTIIASDAGPSTGFVAGVDGGVSVTNNGTIKTAGGFGIATGYATQQVVNHGDILQIAGGADTAGVATGGNLTNDGTIATGGHAVQMGSSGPTLSRIDNSGTIASAHNSAIWSPYTGIAVINRTTGTITGADGFDAIDIATGGRVLNEGTINGNVVLATSGSLEAGSVYVNSGGMLNGNLSLGDGNDYFVARGGATGVSGTIDAGDGVDSYIRSYSADTTVTLGAALPDTFEAEGVEALGNATVTLTASGDGVDGPVTLAGDGRIVNRANLRFVAQDDVNPAPAVTLAGPLDADSGALDFLNQATITGRVVGAARGFANEGTISDIGEAVPGSGAAKPVGPTVDLMAPSDQPFIFTNSGLIAYRNHGASQSYFDRVAVRIRSPEFFAGPSEDMLTLPSASLTNSGVLEGGLSAHLLTPTIDFTNSGTISRARSKTSALTIGQAYSAADSADAVIRLTNSGTISATGESAVALAISAQSRGAPPEGTSPLSTIAVVNSGTISADGGGPISSPSTALVLAGGAVSLANTATALISATGEQSVAIDITTADGTFALDNAGTIRANRLPSDGTAEPEVGVAVKALNNTTSTVRNSGAITGAIVLGDRGDVLTNTGTIDGDVFLGSGDDSMMHTIGGTLTGTVDGGEGTDSLVIDLTGGGALNAALFNRFVHFESEVVSGAGAVTIDDPLPVDTLVVRDAALTIAAGQTLQTMGPVSLTLLGDANSVVNQGTIAGSISAAEGRADITNAGFINGDVHLGGGADKFTLTGTVGGNVDMGTGDDELILQGAWAIGGSVTGGDGTDVVRATFTGSDAQPQQVDLSRFTAFEQLQVQGGAGALSGSAAFGAINVDAGRLIGLSGSTISGNVAVAQGATFGSAGTVNGNVTVSGTLSPGASPGTMTVNGNVALNAGSNSLFEFTPTVSDALVINGSLTIASGAKLTMTGTRPLTPGAYTLVSASGGITGTFGTNVTRDSTVLGVLSYTQNAIKLLSSFQLHDGSTAQVVATNDYLNALLISGKATSGILAAFPALVGSDGYANAAVLKTLSPEPYASAAQMGIENGLAISGALRNVRLAGLNDEGGLFVFGQAYGNWRSFDGDARGVSAADVDGNGYLGGVGYGNSTMGAALFVGRSDSKQRIGGVNARNDADGLFFGGRVHFAAGGFSAGATLLFDRAKADTQRTLGAGGTAKGRYGLHGTTLDAWAGYGFAIGDDWQIGPQLGITHVSVKRGAVTESGGGAFALDVAGRTYDATFLSADLKLEAPGMESLRPWLAAGVRSRVDGSATVATGAFTGTGTTYTVAGVERKKTLPHVGAGIDFAVSKSVSLFVNGDAEFNGRNKEQNANVGVTIRF